MIRDILCPILGILVCLHFLSVESAGVVEIGNLPATVSVFEDAPGSTFLYSVTFYSSPSVNTVTCDFDTSQSNYDIALAPGGGHYIVRLAISPALNYNAGATESLAITCIGGSVSSTSKSLTVNLVENVAPVFSNNPGTVDVSAKTTKASMVIFTLSYTDTDTASPLPHQSLVSTNPIPGTPLFSFANDQLTVLEDLLLYDDEAQYVITVEVADEKTTSTITVTVNINDRNSPPEFVAGANPDEILDLPEMTAGRLLVYSIDSLDAEGDAVQMTETNGVADFELVPATGDIYLLGGITLDYETTTNYVLNVEIRDYIDAQPTSTFTLTINVNDINEQPAFTATPSAVSIQEALASTVVGTLDALCTDPDSDALTYAILFSTESAYFSIDGSTAEVTLALDYDYDDTNLANEVTLTIRCSDPDGLSDDTTYVITFTDINDNSPICSPSSTSFSLSYAQVASSTIVNLGCSDVDSTINAELEYSIIGFSSGYSKTYFQVDTTGNISISTSFLMDYNTSFYVTVLVNDKGTNPGTLSATVTLTVAYTENPITPTYTDVSDSECFLCTTSAITLLSVAGLAMTVILVYLTVLIVLKCCYDRERRKIVKTLSKKKKSTWRWCGCLRPGELKKPKKTKTEIVQAEKRDQEYMRARNALLGVSDDPSNEGPSQSQRSSARPGPSGLKPSKNARRHRNSTGSGATSGIQNVALMGRDQTPDILATPVDLKGLTTSQKVQLERFKDMKKSKDNEGPNAQAASGMVWAFQGR